MYKPFPQHLNLPVIEKEVLDFWKTQDIFKKSVLTRDADHSFVFYEGPPTANGRPGIHHVIGRTMKDFACRFKTMQGYRVERKAGWDTHGLPVEIEVEKKLGFTRKDQIIDYGVDKFNALCRENVWTYKAQWDELTERIGFWLDLDHPYITYETSYIESVWWILKEFWKKDLLYLGHKIVPYCPRCETALSSHELSLGYEEVEDPSVYVKIAVQDDPGTFFLVWTTTPWTLISNVALALHPEVDYVKVLHRGEKLILAEWRLGVLDGAYEILEKKKGRELANIQYQPLFTFCKVDRRAYYIILGEFVTTEDGTGIVHIAPAFGEDDYQAGRRYDLPFLQPINASGQFTGEVTPWKGEFVKDADPKIIEHLKNQNLLYKSELYRHTYPHCWRCKSPLLYYAKRSWYINTSKHKERLVAINRMIKWYPPEVGEGRFGEWLANNVDWALSRDRFWGTPLPIWVCDQCEAKECIGSVSELHERSGKHVDDLHKPFIDEITWQCNSCAGTMRRTPEVIDVWFDSGAMPVAQWHYPFENQDIFKHNFPGDFICEGIDQTRGWFYSLLAIAALLFDEPCFRTCVVFELILDKEGRKMSKSLGNTVDPFDIVDKFGADALRWYLLTNSQPWVPTRFDASGVQEVINKFFGTLINTYAFFAMYANIDKFEFTTNTLPFEQRPEIDRWLLSALNRTVARVEETYSRYDVTRGARTISDFVIDDLSNWYVRRCRRRFWKSEMGLDKQSAYETLHHVLLTVSKLMAPVAPFTAEALYHRLINTNGYAAGIPESVHLCEFPSARQPAFQFREPDLEMKMEMVREIVAAGRTLRNAKAIKVRQPLRRLLVVAANEQKRSAVLAGSSLIKDELNVKSVDLVENTEALMIARAEPIFKSLGPKFGKKANAVAEAIRLLTPVQIRQLEAAGKLTVTIQDEEVTIGREDFRVQAEHAPGLAVLSEGDWTVAIDTILDEALINEGLAREFVNRVQNMRKDAGFEVVDRIRIYYEGSEVLHRALESSAGYVKNETLAETLERNSLSTHDAYREEWEINGDKTVISIERV
ncbi:MAG: isoleucine--tRNA ligase [candidate division KSB1 bacterium]|nr:isoleucine--tRNA ligase [candidate division KSB1 bacterium]MDZ7303461.1 isoleucine--tRNA ligase [candidate division KSB1 bacterium]MDZ7312543.1 isoleucine--tRNA ligase [candidate division KSB1 bacterium]